MLSSLLTLWWLCYEVDGQAVTMRQVTRARRRGCAMGDASLQVPHGAWPQEVG